MQNPRRLSRAPKTPQNDAAPPSRLPTTGRASDMRRMSWAPPTDRRVSGFTGRPSVIPKTDVRKRAKEYKDKVINFLCQIDESQSAASLEKLISTKVGYKECFEVILSQIFSDNENEQFKIVDKLELEIPEIMEQFGYPYTIKAAYFQPVGVLHTFPHLLAILAFLVDIYDAYDQISQNPQSGLNHSDTKDSTTVAFNYAFLLTTFKKSNNHQYDEIAAEEFLVREREAFIAAFDEQDEIAGEFESLEAEAQQLAEKAELLQNEMDQLQEIKSRTAERAKSASKFCTFMLLKTNENKRLERDLEGLKTEKAHCDNETRTLNNELDDLKRRLATQGLSGEEARALNRECQMLKESIIETNTKIEKLKASNDLTLREAMKLGNAVSEDFLELVSTMETLWNSFEGESLDFDFFRRMTAVEIASEVQEGEHIRQVHQKLLERLASATESIENDQKRIRAGGAALEKQINDFNVAIHKVRVEYSRTVTKRETQEHNHEDELSQLNQQLELKKGERKLYDKERPDVAEMRQKLCEEQQKLMAKQREYERTCQERSDQILIDSKEILSEMESIENGKKKIQQFEEEVRNSINNVIKVFNK